MDNQPRDTSAEGREREIFRCLHEIKSSLQSLMVANEMVMEAWGTIKGSGLQDDAPMLLRKMMEEIEKIHRAANEIEQACEKGEL